MRAALPFVLTCAVVIPASAQTPAEQVPPQTAPSAPAPSAATPSAEIPIVLSAAQAIRCVFPVYVATRWIEGVPEPVNGTDELTFEIQTINLKARTARVSASRGSALVSAFVTETGMNVIEQTPLGNFILTTIFSGGREGNRLRAVHSRHLGDVAELPTPSQYFGTCEILR
jgi:hypothetical protein